MQIHGWNKTTLLDYPGKVAATLFTGACNFRCPFCHNSSLVLHPHQEPVIEEATVLSFLKKRKGILDGVCITGGEPTLHSDLTSFIIQIKELGYSVKLDTNGYRPDVIRTLINGKLIDMIAMDIKSDQDGYAAAAGLKDLNLHVIDASVDLIRSSALPYEFRTTIARELHSPETIVRIGDWLAGCSAYYLQAYRDSEHVISPGFTSYTRAELEGFAEKLRKKIPLVEIRGIDS